jgi:hypothetical protein
MASPFSFSKVFALTLTMIVSAAPAALATPVAPCGDDDADRFQIASIYRPVGWWPMRMSRLSR